MKLSACLVQRKRLKFPGAFRQVSPSVLQLPLPQATRNTEAQTPSKSQLQSDSLLKAPRVSRMFYGIPDTLNSCLLCCLPYR